MSSWARLGPVHSDWNTILCFSCGKSGHGVSRCLEMNETSKYVARVGGSFVMISPGSSPGGKRRLIRGRG